MTPILLCDVIVGRKKAICLCVFSIVCLTQAFLVLQALPYMSAGSTYIQSPHFIANTNTVSLSLSLVEIGLMAFLKVGFSNGTML